MQRVAWAASGAALSSRILRAQVSLSQASVTAGSSPLGLIPKDFTGISIESPQLYNPTYFSVANKSLVEAYRSLSRNGVLRSGGHLSDVARWVGLNGDFSTPKQDAGIEKGKTYWEWKLTDPSIRDTREGAITTKSINNLKGFLDATGWRLIYGLNFGCGSAARAADEASYVARVMGDRLIAFQLGNEDDQFGGMAFFRERGYNFDIYYGEYQEFVAAVRKAVPHAVFGGPDVAGNMSWVRGFATKTDNQAVFLSSHFYAMGPAKDPAMDATRLLSPNPRLEKQFQQISEARAAANGLPFRMTEGNSCFGGGKPNVSDAFASALWGADYMLQCASAGYAGVNLHGGGDGFYTPIAVGPSLSTELRPLFYGMQFADRFAGAELLTCTLQTSANLRAYHARRNKETLLALINKGPDPIEVRLAGFGKASRPATEMRLTAPSLDAKTGVAFAPRKQASSSTTLEPYSAALMTWT